MRKTRKLKKGPVGKITWATPQTAAIVAKKAPANEESIEERALTVAQRLVYAIERIGIVPPGPVVAHKDARGGHVECLTEAVISLSTAHESSQGLVARGLHDIADAIREHANAVRESKS